jgi:hypothetical protein
MLLTNEQKQEIINLYWDDFYAMNIIDWFSEKYPKDVKQALKQALKYKNISWREWKKACKAVECFDFDASELTEEVELDTMNILLEKANVDPYET